MRRYLASRLLQAILVAWGVSTVVFGLLHLSGDPTRLMLPEDASVEARAQLRHSMGFDQPLWLQYLQFMGRLVRLDFQHSYRQNLPAMDLVVERLPATYSLAGAALVVAVVLAVPLGILAAVHRDKWIDGVASVVALIGQTVPTYWLGILAIMLFAVKLRWFPSSGGNGLRGLVLPATTLAAFSMARIARIARAEMLEVLRQDYIRTARSKGLRESVVVYKHALRNASLTLVTVIGLELGVLLGGAIVTETVFAWPGVGRLAINGIYGRDYPVIQATVFMMAITFVVLNTTTDLLYAVLDPKISLYKRGDGGA